MQKFICLFDRNRVKSRYIHTINSSKALRELFLEYFSSRGHLRVPSSSVLAKHYQYNQYDFTCAGIQQFTPVLINEQRPPARRVVNSQKCIRLVDLDLVGVDNTHHTFFEMLGNWSFGDYYKKEACAFAWEFLTDVLHIDPCQLYVTYFGGDGVFEADIETRDCWRQLGISDSNLLAFNNDNNFWKLGPVGPCGTSTEIHIHKPCGTYQQENFAHLVNTGDTFMVELWNIVFMQFNRHHDGTFTRLPLENVVDTGMGLERLCALMQNCDSAYETDLFRPLMNRINELSSRNVIYQGRLGEKDANGTDTAFRVVTDHMRTIVISLAEGFKITNTKHFARTIKDLYKKMALKANEILHIPRGALAELVPLVVSQLGDAHPDLRQNEQAIVNKVRIEEERMWAQRDEGWKRLQNMIRVLPKGTELFPGKFAYKLVYEYRLEISLIRELLVKRGLSLDEEEFNSMVNERRRRTLPFKKPH